MSKQLSYFITSLITSAAVAFIVGLIFYNKGVKDGVNKETTHIVDTVTIYQTLRDTVILTETRVIERRDTVLLQVPGDSIKVPVIVPYEAREYAGQYYRLQISGYNPILDWININAPTKIVTQTVTETKYRNHRWGIGVQIGYGYSFAANKPYPYVGIGLSYNFLTF